MKLITLENLKSFWKDVKSYVDNGLSKKADSVHGTHVTYGTINGKAPGTPSAGTSSKVAREDHVHPVQTTVSGNAGSATKLATPRTINGTNFDGTANITTANWGTARTLTIGKTGKSVNGSGNVSWTLDEIGAAAVSHAQDFSGANSNTYIAYPKDGRYRGTPDNASVTGYLKITLPQSWTSSMMKFDVDVFNYADNETMTYTISGYNYSSGANSAWHSATAACKTHQSNPKRNLSVRFGHDGTKCAIYIGEASTTWAYPQVTVKNITVGYSNYALTSWNAGWVVGYTTTLGTISRTVTNPYVGNGGMASTANTLATARTINGTSFNGSGNITTANWGTARTLTIGNSAKSVNGSANISWTLDEMGARPRVKKIIDLSNTTTYHVDKWYPCLADIPYDGMHNIEVAVQLNSGVKPSWATHAAGFTCNLHVKAIAGGWGTTSGDSIVLNHTYGFASANPCSYSQLNNSSNAVLWLRGGGKYFVFTDWNASWNVKTASTEINSQTVAPATSCPSISLTRSTMIANLSGNASTATKATQDSAGQQINTTYIKGLSVNGKTITYTKGDGSTGTITTQDTNTTYSTGTASALGLTKLYTGTGTATDGTMTQAAIKTALDGKAAASHTHNYVPTSDYSLTTISKTLTLTTSWQDTGITGSNLSTGTYIVQVSGMSAEATSLYQEIWSGTMSWFQGTTNSTDSDEIILHKAGHASNGRTIYLRTIRTSNSGYLKLQIASSHALSSSNITFKFRKLI